MIHVLQHIALEGPARIADIARAMGQAVRVHRLDEGDRLPDARAQGDALVVMGGPMGVGDIGNPRWPFLAAEVTLLDHWLRDGGPVLGVCLGAQLMARALGARVYPLTVGDPAALHREVGWGAVTFTANGADEPALAGLDPSEVVLHWHGDTFDLPPGATRLASTLACENQMFRWGARAFGVQFHVEVNAEDIGAWVRADAAFVQGANGAAGGDRILADTRRYMERHRASGDRMIRNVLTAMLT